MSEQKPKREILMDTKSATPKAFATSKAVLFSFILALCTYVPLQTAADNEGHKTVGLTLSGGGAKGFAHIGVLHIIDSLGLKVNFITGTSMGSIVGALYASGYSAIEIEEFALSVDWATVFNAKPELENIHIRNRYQFGKSLIEVPFENLRLVIGTGAIEGQQLWSLLEQLFFRVRETVAFDDLPIPFACVATNIETGEPEILSSGDIVSALRASMAIPAVFTSVDRDGNRLVDGGVVNNFPVDVVKKMGAEYVVGVNVSHGLKNAGELKTPVDIIYQMGFFKDAYMFRKNKEITDLFITPDLDGFEASSFGHVQQIIERGKQMARLYIPEIKTLAQMNPENAGQTSEPAPRQYIVLDEVSFQGLQNIRESYISNITRFKAGDTLFAEQLNTLTKKLYATGYFERVTYNYVPIDKNPNRKHLVFYFSENPTNKLRMGLHYNSFLGIGLIGGFSTNRLFLYNLNGDLSFRLGEQPAYRIAVDFFASDKQNNWIGLRSEGDQLEFPYYENFVPVAAYKQRYNRIDLSFNQLVGRNAYFYAGSAFYSQNLKPTIQTDYAVSGENRGYEAFLGFRMYTLDRHSFSRSGKNISLSASYFFGQNPSIEVVTDDQTIRDLDKIGITIGEFIQFKFNFDYYLPLTQRSSYFTRIQAAYNFNYTQGFLNMFAVGGTNPFLRDQILFAGLSEYDIITPAVLSAGLGWNYNVWSDFFINPVINAAIYDFQFEKLRDVNHDNLLLGSAFSLGYNSSLGPIVASVSYSLQSKNVLGYISMGWCF
jgi:NTE family protein